ncbi:hypothetical protein HYV81_03705 [Candidatus Woesearchaeota archaeon]|nr:hypothetical protein [Candidatus Woesearchaeota archaeon]
MDRKQISKTKYIAAFATTTLIFLIGLLIGSYITNIKLQKLDQLEQDLRIDTLAVEIEYLLISENPCTGINTRFMTDQLYNVGTRLDFMESNLGEGDQRVQALKSYYSLLEMRHWLFIRKTVEECESDVVPILYFYSNQGDCPSCEEQGWVLNYIRQKYPQTRVYSFDLNINNSALAALRDIYEVQQAPAIIINNEKHIGFLDREAVEQLLNPV